MMTVFAVVVVTQQLQCFHPWLAPAQLRSRAQASIPLEGILGHAVGKERGQQDSSHHGRS